MSVSQTRLDAAWLTTIPLAGIPGRSLGQPAGTFTVGLSITGDASAGLVVVEGDLSFTKKQEFVYEFQLIRAFADALVDDDAMLTINTGPVLPVAPIGAFTNATYRDFQPELGGTNIQISSCPFELGSPNHPVYVYGDKLAAGAFTMLQVAWNENVTNVGYFVFAWGFYYLYETFFRGQRPG